MVILSGMNTKQLKQVRSRLDNFLEELLKLIGRSERRHWAAFYVQGLLSEIERKTAAGIASRFPTGNVQAAQQLLQGSPWDYAPVRQALTHKAIAEMKPVEVCIIDDTGFPKKGKHSVGVARQYSGTLGKVENCQVAVSLHYANEQASFPMDWALYLPESWTDDPERCRKAGVPPDVTFKRKWELALELIDRSLTNGISPGVIVADSSYGSVTKFREGLESRRLTYCVGIDSTLTFWREETQRRPVTYKGFGRPPVPRYFPDAAPETARQIADALPDDSWEDLVYWQGTKGPLSAPFAALWVQPAHGYKQQQPEQPMVWLLIQKTPDKKTPYAFYLSNMDASTPLSQLVKVTRLRWRIEMDYQTLKGQVGLDHYEGRTWLGWHHHVTLTTMAFVFLLLERLRGAFPPSTLTNNSAYDTTIYIG